MVRPPSSTFFITSAPEQDDTKKERHDEWDSRDSDNKWHKSKAPPDSKISRGGFRMNPSAHPSCNGDCLILSAGWLHKYPLFKNKCGNRFYFGRTLRDLARILITKECGCNIHGTSQGKRKAKTVPLIPLTPMSEKPHKPIKSEHKGEMRTPEPSARFSAGAFREWLKTQKFSEEFMMREACDLAMADDTMKTLEDLPAGVMEHLWKSRERIKTEWMLKYGEIVSVTP
jgi:hypothetical protein